MFPRQFSLRGFLFFPHFSHMLQIIKKAGIQNYHDPFFEGKEFFQSYITHEKEQLPPKT